MITRLSLRRGMRPLLLAAALVLPAACSRNHPGPDDESMNGPAKIVFTNESLNQADLFAVVQGGQARKLGTVMAGRTEELVVPADIVRRSGNLNLVARLLARSNTPSSGPVAFHAGDRLLVRLPIDGKTLFVAPAPG
ncbi:MAG: hypothetical protein ABI601_04770 [bacterium]